MNTSPRNGRMMFGAACAAVLLAVVLAYANHFHNSFHFDDWHTVTGNPAIRSLANVPGFFRDGRTFSVLPANASYRPLVSATLSLDYWLGGGLNPLWFHLSTFIWFLAQLALMVLLFVRIAGKSRPRPRCQSRKARRPPNWSTDHLARPRRSKNEKGNERLD